MEPAFALVVGEALVDVVTTADGVTVERPGGSAANVAVALARLRRPTLLASSWADDAHGAMIAAHLAGSQVRDATDPHILARTSTAAATIAADGSASYVFDLDWRLGPVPDLAPAFVHVCSIGAVLTPGADDVLALLDRFADRTRDGSGVFVSYDINSRPAITGSGPDVVARVEAVARRADLIKASDEDLAVTYPHLGLDEAAAHLLTLGPEAVVVTRGETGASWYDARQRLDVASEPTRVVDTIGAGDTFAAALIDARWSGLDPADSVARAVRAAAVTVSRAGADPPRREDLRRPRRVD